MPTGRFDVGVGQKYVSTYVPLPFEEISSIAKDYQKQHDLGKMLPNELDKLANALQAAPIHQDYKDKVVKGAHESITKIVDDAHGNYASPEFQKKAMDAIYAFKNNPDVQNIMNTKNWWDKNYEAYANNPKNADDLNYTLQKDAAHQTGYKQTNQGVYALKVTPYADINDESRKVIGNIAESGWMKDAGIDPSKGVQVMNGQHMMYSHTKKGWVGVDEDKLKLTAEMTADLLGNSQAGKYETQKQLGSYLEAAGIDPHKVDYRTLQNLASAEAADAKSKGIENPNKYGELAKHMKEQFTNTLFRTGVPQLGGKSTSETDNQFQHNEDYADAKKKKELAAGLIGSTIESPTFDLTNFDPNFKALKEKDIFTKDDKGQLIVDMSKTKETTYKVKLKDGSYKFYENKARALSDFTNHAWDFGVKDSKDLKFESVDGTTKKHELAKQMDKMARAVGWYEQPGHNNLRTDDYNNILQAYNLTSKARMAGEMFNPVVSNLNSQKIESQWENYMGYDPTDIDTPTEAKPERMEGDKIVAQNRLTNSNGQTIITGQVVRKDGTRQPFAVSSNSKQEDMYFNAVSDVALKSAKFLTHNSDSPEWKNYGTTTINKKTYKVVTDEDLPNGYHVTVIANPHNKLDQHYVVKAGNKPEDLHTFDSYAEAQLFLNNAYYTSTPYGNSDVTQLQSDQKQSENYR